MEAVSYQINLADNEGWTPLHLAAQRSNTIVEKLLQKGASVEAKTHSKRTALHIAADNQQYDIMKQLLEARVQPVEDESDKVPDLRADVNLSDVDELTPLHLAAKGSDDRIVKLLWAHGANFGAKTKTKQTSLHIAAASGTAEIIRQLLWAGLKRDLKDIDGKTALHLLCQLDENDGSRKEALDVLLQDIKDKGRYLNHTDKSGATALHIAYKSRNMMMIEQLLDSKAKAAPTGENKGTVSVIGQAIKDIDLEHKKVATERLKREKLEKEELEKEQLENEQLENEQLENEQLEKERLEKERLSRARLEKRKLRKEKLARNKNLQMIQMLLKGCPEEIGGNDDKDRENAAKWLVDKVERTKKLREAATGGSVDVAMAKALLSLDNEFNVEEKDNDLTMLHQLVKKGPVELINILIETQDADTEARTDNDELTPLLLAIKHGRKDATKALLINGADIEAKRKSDRRGVLHMAIEFNGNTNPHEKKENPDPPMNKSGKVDMDRKAKENKDQQAEKKDQQPGKKGHSPPNQPPSKSETALVKPEDLVQLLLKYGADIDAKDKDGKTALKLAKVMGGRENCAKMLKDPLIIIPRPHSARPVKSPKKLPENEKNFCLNFDALIMDFYIQKNVNLEAESNIGQAKDNQLKGNQSFVKTRSPAYETINKLQRIRSVYELMDTGPGTLMKEAYAQMLEDLNVKEMNHDRRMRWIHIPANNVSKLTHFIVNILIVSKDSLGEGKLVLCTQH